MIRVMCKGSDVTLVDAHGVAFVTPKPEERFYLAFLDSAEVPLEAELLPGFLTHIIRKGLIEHDDVDGTVKLQLQLASMNPTELSEDFIDEFNAERKQQLKSGSKSHEGQE